MENFLLGIRTGIDHLWLGTGIWDGAFTLRNEEYGWNLNC